MPVIRSFGRNDQHIARDSSIEVAGEFEEPVVIKRWTGISGGDDALMQAGTDTFKNIRATASIAELSAQEVASSGNLYALGDLRAEFRTVVYGEENGDGGDGQSAGRKADRVIYRGREYKLVGTPDKKFFGASWFWQVVLRKVKP